MTKNRQEYRIESSRLREWDYSNPWWYYVTINTKNHVAYFGLVEKEKVVLSEIGKVAEKCWQEIASHFENVESDYFVIMPNHIHGIIIINKAVETRHASSLHHKNLTLSDVVGSFKSTVTKLIRELGYSDFSWQPRFYDRIIRNEKELYYIRKYIEQNLLKWELEKNNPENIFDL